MVAGWRRFEGLGFFVSEVTYVRTCVYSGNEQNADNVRDVREPVVAFPDRQASCPPTERRRYDTTTD
jgi:hypothetical protein